jgi:hypothetical protein
MDETIKLDDKYKVLIKQGGKEVVLLRYGEEWHVPVAQKPWIVAAYTIQYLEDEMHMYKNDCDILTKRIEELEREKGLNPDG